MRWTVRSKLAAGASLVGCLATAAIWQMGWHTPRAQNTERLQCDTALAPAATPHPGMVWVPAGTVAMGDTVYQEEQPIQTSQLKGFWMDRTEVTNAQFAAFVAATGYVTVAERPVDTQAHPGLPPELQQPGAVVFVPPTELRNGGDVRQWWQYRAGANWRHPGGPDTSTAGKDAFPVVAVTIDDAQAYARWKGHALPTEAEWEWAAQGGAPATSGKTDQPAQANTWQGIFPIQNAATDGFVGVAPVACYAPNGYGLFDMIGNVWELTRDRYRPFHDARDNRPPDQEPQGSWTVGRSAQVKGGGRRPEDTEQNAPPSSIPTQELQRQQQPKQHVIKGGSYLCAPNYCMRYRAGARQGQDDDLATSHLGFRTILRDTANVAAHPEKP
ncbi:MAG: cysteine-type sulfatase aerobic maturase [Burkholderiales bacterium PBB3]|nr:MAG: cysteine-type sulfatase aerobic maturase [Burkholderiales bacterium PBB3]